MAIINLCWFPNPFKRLSYITTQFLTNLLVGNRLYCETDFLSIYCESADYEFEDRMLFPLLKTYSKPEENRKNITHNSMTVLSEALEVLLLSKLESL